MISKHFETKGWSLFLDRDGVINKRLEGDYVKNPAEFVFIDGVLEAIATLRSHFQRIFVVTNQQGIGKGLMTEEDLHKVHDFMLASIREKGGSIDKVYYCPNKNEDNHPNRKPNTGMALLAKSEFEDLILHQSVMLGDSETDMQFGRKLGMITILVGDKNEKIREDLVDLRFNDLKSFADFIQKA